MIAGLDAITLASGAVPSLLTKPETAEWLRLTGPGADEKGIAADVRAVGRLVEERRLRPVGISGRHLFDRAELEDSVRRETEAAPLAARGGA